MRLQSLTLWPVRAWSIGEQARMFGALYLRRFVSNLRSTNCIRRSVPSGPVRGSTWPSFRRVFCGCGCRDAIVFVFMHANLMRERVTTHADMFFNTIADPRRRGKSPSAAPMGQALTSTPPAAQRHLARGKLGDRWPEISMYHVRSHRATGLRVRPVFMCVSAFGR